MKMATQPNAQLTHVAKLIEDIPIAMLTTAQDGEAITSCPMAVLKFVPDAADYWDGPSSQMVRAFGIIASVIAGKPVAMGEHGSHSGLPSPTPATAAMS